MNEPTILFTNAEQRTVAISSKHGHTTIYTFNRFPDGGGYVKVTSIASGGNNSTSFSVETAREVTAMYDAWQAELAAATEK